MQDPKRYFDLNRQLWDRRTSVHIAADFYHLKAFRSGATSLNRIELEELGDVAGKSLLHLQCHFGMDTISWAREGALATGLDFSEKAIQEARTLSQELQLPVDFVCCNVYDANQYLDKTFDIIFTSYGTIGWLPDLNKWADVVSSLLKAGGTFYMVDFHPVIWMFDDNFHNFKYSYFNSGEPIVIENAGTYADRTASIQGIEYGWNHSLSDILNALIAKGLTITRFNEHGYSPYNCFNNMVETATGEWQIKGLENKVPLLYSIQAFKH